MRKDKSDTGDTEREISDMKRCISIVILLFAIMILSGCEPQYTEEELYQMCVDTYMEENAPDLTFEVKEHYETVEDTYQELIRLAVWSEEKGYELDHIFYRDNYQWDKAVNEIVKPRNLSWYDLEEWFHEEKFSYKKLLKNNTKKYLTQILKVSCDEIQNNESEIYSVLSEGGLNYLARAEEERIKKDYKWMFIIICNMDIPQDIFYRLYPDEMYQGAMDCIYHPITKDSIQKAKDFLTAIGEYEKYADDIEEAFVLVHEAERCDYGSCQFKGDREAKYYDGEFCASHAYYLDNGGRLEKKIRPSKNGWSSGGLGLGIDSDDMDENESSSSNKNSSAEKEEKDEKEKELPYDPYDVYDYWDPEDFYYDWEEDFDGYEDAEDYWYDAWDKVE